MYPWPEEPEDEREKSGEGGGDDMVDESKREEGEWGRGRRIGGHLKLTRRVR